MTVLLVVLLLVINGCLVAAEFALAKVSTVRIQAPADKGHYFARLTSGIKGDLEPYLAACHGYYSPMAINFYQYFRKQNRG